MPDPTAVHHAQILDWLSAALTDPMTASIYFFQDTARDGKWEVSATVDVDPAKEAEAASQADRDLLGVYTLGGTSPARPAWVDNADMDPDPYDVGGVLRESEAEEEFTPDPATGACRCADCQALDKADWEKALTEDVEWTATKHGETITATFTGPRDLLTDLLLALYGYAQKEN